MIRGVEPQVERVANAIMMAFIKKWFQNPNYSGPVYFDCVNGEMSWLNEAKAAISVAMEECAKIADAYAEENLRMAGDSVILDPCLGGHGFSPENIEESKKQMVNGCIHSSMYHAATNVAEAIRGLSSTLTSNNSGSEK